VPYIVKNLPALIATSSGSSVTQAIGKLDDASSITMFFASSYAAGTTGSVIQISQFDPFDPFPQPGVTESSGFYVISSSALAFATTNSNALVLSNISFRGLRIASLSSAIAGEVISWVSKQISV
jgi:hypothetical protein